MEFLHFEKLNGLQFPDIVAPEDVMVIPLSSPEHHGPHLPLGTDGFISEEVAKRAAKEFASCYPNSKIFLYPTLHLGGATISEVGSVKVKSTDLKKCLKFLGRRLIKQGFRRIAFISAHGAPPHVDALDKASSSLTRIIRRKGQGGGAVAPYSRVAGNVFAGLYIDQWKSDGIELPDQARLFLEEDLHGGWIETSMMLASRPDLLDDIYLSTPDLLAPDRKWLNVIENGIRWFFRKLNMPELKLTEGLTGLRLGKLDLSWILHGRHMGYCGRPALATKDFGDALMDSMSLDIATAFENVFVKGMPPSEYRSAAFWFNWLKTLGWIAVIGLILILVLTFR